MTRYSYTSGSRLGLLAFMVGFGVFAVFLVVTALTRPDGPPLAFVILWIAALGWNAYWWLWRLSYRLEVDGDRLRWATPLRTGEVLVSDIQGIRSGFLGQTAVIELRERPALTCLLRGGFVEFATALAEDRGIPLVPTSSNRTWGFGRMTGFRREE